MSFSFHKRTLFELLVHFDSKLLQKHPSHGAGPQVLSKKVPVPKSLQSNCKTTDNKWKLVNMHGDNENILVNTTVLVAVHKLSTIPLIPFSSVF